MRLLIAALVSGLALVGVASPASAERVTVDDPAHDHVQEGGQDFHGAGDVIKVRVDHAPRRVFVDTVFRTRPYDELMVFYDTRKKRPGPELYLLKTHLGVSLWRITADQDPKRVRCHDKGVKYLVKEKTWASHVNRRCLRSPGGSLPQQVRIRVLSASDDYFFTSDYAPGEYKYTPWVQHN
jgi:hypothetical protein